jgi:hemerythrin-like metal-binding protein
MQNKESISGPFTDKIRLTEELEKIADHISIPGIDSRTISSFIPWDFLNFLKEHQVNSESLQLGASSSAEITIFFSDIRDFTSLTENMSPDESFLFLIEYYKKVGPIIKKYGGFIDKYIGDAVMALFPDCPENAVKAAVEMIGMLKEYNKDLSESGKPEINIGIGIHTGPVMLGILGHQDHVDSTVISDAVNTASRIESITKRYRVPVIISEKTLTGISALENYNFRFLDFVYVKGKSEPLALFEIYDGNSEKQIHLKNATKRNFETGVQLFHNNEYNASSNQFREVLKNNPEDRAAVFFLHRVAAGIVEGRNLLDRSAEALFPWNESLITGVNIIDEQHRMLINLINELNLALANGWDYEVRLRILNGLQIYTLAHFSMEEEMMIRSEYSGFEQHKAIHNDFTKKVSEFYTSYESGKADLSQEILNFLKEWVADHILIKDKEMAPHVLIHSVNSDEDISEKINLLSGSFH